MHKAERKDETESHKAKITLLESNFDKYSQDMQVKFSKAHADLNDALAYCRKENKVLTQ